jgi:CDP-glycerol glycerophosphotransferase
VQIVYRSFDGRYSDNPRALHEALLARGDAVEHVWMCAPGREGEFPAGTTTVPVEDDQTVQALESADLVVSNTHIELDWTKRPGATYLQTWHGTPLKAIHRDVGFNPGGVPAAVDRDIARWDLLLTQNADSTELLPRIFGYHGQVHETGYPRNDLFQAPDTASRREQIRTALGIPAGTTAVLYAPTWRDDDVAGDGADFDLELDVARFAERLGDDHVLLVRLHYIVSDALGDLDVPGVLDLSEYPDIRDLHLAADLLVTDYASAQFDFAVTGKPIVYFDHDLDHYRGELRDFYFDFEALAPGPMIATTDDVLDAIADVPGLQSRFADRYARFRDRFCSREDGHATARVLDLVLPDQARERQAG